MSCYSCTSTWTQTHPYTSWKGFFQGGFLSQGKFLLQSCVPPVPHSPSCHRACHPHSATVPTLWHPGSAAVMLWGTRAWGCTRRHKTQEPWRVCLISVWDEGKLLYLPEKQCGFKIFTKSGAFLFFSFSYIQCKATVTLKHNLGTVTVHPFPIVMLEKQLKTVKAKQASVFQWNFSELRGW